MADTVKKNSEAEINKLNYWKELYLDAVSKRSEIDRRIDRRNKLYDGTAQPINPKNGTESSKKTDCNRNMCFELIETQVNNSIPQPKVTPRDASNSSLSSNIEGYLQMEMDRMMSESMNDKAERGTYKQGTVFYFVGWDETINTCKSNGEMVVKVYSLKDVYPQPGITNFKTDCEYIFVRDRVSIKKIKEVFNVTVLEDSNYKGLCDLITVYYYNKDGYVSRFGWVDKQDIVVFDEEAYELRKFKVCAKCGARINTQDACPKCGSTKFEYVASEYEILDQDLVEYDEDNVQNSKVIMRAGERLKYYRVNQLPFVLRVNISSEDSIYGISDIDVLETNQVTMNKLSTKMTENVLKAGSLVTVPQGVNVPNTDETLKIVKIKDPNMLKAFGVQAIQANMQQDEIWLERCYQMGRESLGITDSYQGKRDTTAESGKAKQVSAAQAAGRMESKRRMKDAAYADLYELMFKYLLAYCDEPRKFAKIKPNGEYEDGSFSRYNFLEKDENGDVVYNDRYLFSVDDASTLTTNRSAMWQETTNNFVAGTFGNPADPNTQIMYWTVMKGLNYPLAKQVLTNIQERNKQLPMELQQAIMQNPEILATVQQVLSNGGENPNVQGSEQ